MTSRVSHRRDPVRLLGSARKGSQLTGGGNDLQLVSATFRKDDNGAAVCINITKPTDVVFCSMQSKLVNKSQSKMVASNLQRSNLSCVQSCRCGSRLSCRHQTHTQATQPGHFKTRRHDTTGHINTLAVAMETRSFNPSQCRSSSEPHYY